MLKNLFDTCVFWSCVTRCGCRTTSSTLFTVKGDWFMYVDSRLAFSPHQGVTKRFGLSWALGLPIPSSYMNPNAWEGSVVAGSQSQTQYSCSQCTWSPNKLWRSNFIFNLWCTVAHRGNYFHPDTYSVLPSDTQEGFSLTKG